MKYNSYPKRDVIKNYFPVPNEIFNLGLRAGEIALYAFLLKCEDRKTFKCWPSYKTISKALNITKNTVKTYVDKLCEKQLITVEYTYIFTKDGKKRNGSLMYTIRPIQEAINYDVVKQFERNALAVKKAELEKKFQKYMDSKTESAG
ncbi:MAG: helix-turn-helix domain-containing protein [Ruminococcaceae bacterium]|nr:helix-turn-helix domain-containing protein [Oscillospiraceae bacterium]